MWNPQLGLNGPAGPIFKFSDDVLGRGDAPSTALNAIMTLPAAPESGADDLNVDYWMKESFDAAKQTAYHSPIGADAGPFMLTPSYRTAARSVAEKRSGSAGARLAKILNDELK